MNTDESDSAGVEVDVNLIDCSGCGAALNIVDSLSRGQAVCQSCGSVLDLSTPEYRVLSKLVLGGYTPRSKLKIGLTGSFNGVRYRIVGRLRYEQPDCYWEEWFLVAPDGSACYLEEDDGDWRLLIPMTPKAAPTRKDLEDRSVNLLNVDDDRYTVVERGSATIEYFEGQMAWRVKAGTTVQFIDARKGADRLAIEWTKRELEYYRGETYTSQRIASAFGLPSVLPMSLGRSNAGPGLNDTGKIIFVMILLFFVIALAATGSCRSVFGSGGHYSSGGFGGK